MKMISNKRTVFYNCASQLRYSYPPGLPVNYVERKTARKELYTYKPDIKIAVNNYFLVYWKLMEKEVQKTHRLQVCADFKTQDTTLTLAPNRVFIRRV